MDTDKIADLFRRVPPQDHEVPTRAPNDPVAATNRCLALIAASNARIGAMTHIDLEGASRDARASARRIADGKPLSSIDGLPMAIKANIAVAGWPWTAGIAAHAGRRAEYDAACIARLRAAGVVMIGATNMDEGALGALTDNPRFGRTHHPNRAGFTAGGSSGGSAAAVAAGYCDAALGTDTIGSVRIPASYCGIAGHKPCRGDINTGGVVPLSPTLDTVGAMARDVATCRTLTAIASGRATLSAPPAPRTVGVADWGAMIDDPSIAAMVAHAADAVAGLGARMVTLDAATFRLARLQTLLLVIAEVEGAEVHEQVLRERPEGFSPAFAALMAWGAGPGVARYQAAQREVEAICAATRTALHGIDALILPATPQTAFAFDGPVPPNQSLFATLASALGDPATVVPFGCSNDGLPIGIQVMAADGDLCLALATVLAGQCGSSPPETFIDSAVM